MHKDPQARAIAENLLHRSGTALLGSDFDSFAACFEFPNDVETFNQRKTVETAQELRVIFDNVLLHFRRTGVTSMERHVLEAHRRDPDTVSCTHISHLLNGPNLLQRPYPVFSLLNRGQDGIWRITYGTYGISQEPETEKALCADVLEMRKPMS